MFFKKTKQNKKAKERERVWHVNQLLLRTSRVPNPTRRCGRTVRSSASAGSSQLRPGPAPGPRVPGPQAAPARGEARKVQAVVQQRTAGGGLRTQREASPPAAQDPTTPPSEHLYIGLLR